MEAGRGTGITGRVQVDMVAEGATVAGVLIRGADADQLRTIVREELERARANADEQAARSLDTFADSLWLCQAGERGTIGFAVDHSGAVLCPAAVGTITVARHLMSDTERTVTDRRSRRVLQIVNVGAPTVGVVRAFAPVPNWADVLYVFDRHGHRRQVRLRVIELSGLQVGGPPDGFVLDDALAVTPPDGAHIDPVDELIGGPLVTAVGEVVGVVVAASLSGELFVQPWKPLDRCIDMDARPA